MGLVVQMSGALLVLGAFGLAQLRVVTPASLSYLLMNAVGSALLVGSAFAGGQWGFVLLNVVWFAFSAVSLARYRSLRAA
ncbi:MAG TPA: hypothetical protein VM433_02020 [Mycobacteriales bacterium]|nr:hypothetical protein [Mycobacteriales bacterium]